MSSYPKTVVKRLRDKWPDNGTAGSFLPNESADLIETLEFALEEAQEGIEILDNLIDSVQKHGNYSKDATLLFLSHARQCFNAIHGMKVSES